MNAMQNIDDLLVECWLVTPLLICSFEPITFYMFGTEITIVTKVAITMEIDIGVMYLRCILYK